MFDNSVFLSAKTYHLSYCFKWIKSPLWWFLRFFRMKKFKRCCLTRLLVSYFGIYSVNWIKPPPNLPCGLLCANALMRISYFKLSNLKHSPYFPEFKLLNEVHFINLRWKCSFKWVLWCFRMVLWVFEITGKFPQWKESGTWLILKWTAEVRYVAI